MLKYVAILVITVAGYYYWNKHDLQQARATLPALPKVRIAKPLTAPRNPAKAQARAASASIKAPDITQDSGTQEFTYPEIQKLIANNDVCALHKLLEDIRNKDEEWIYVDAFLEATGLREFKDLIGVNGPLFKELPPENKDPRAVFLDAMVTGGLVTNAKRDKLDSEKSLRQLNGLVKAFPNNAAFSIFKLNLENAMGKSKSQLRETAKGISAAQHYDTFLADIRAHVLSHRWDSEALYYLAGKVRNSIPGIHVARGIDNGALIEDAETAEHLGNILVSKAIASDKLSISEAYDAYDYYAGNRLLNNKHPDISELNEQKHPGKSEAIEKNWVSYDLDGEICDRTSFDEHFAKLRNQF